eukprot:6438084-Ditylum_brightwellii.AAC.1
MQISFLDYVEEVGDDLEKVKEEEYANSMESTCNYCIEEFVSSDVVGSAACAIIFATTAMMLFL